MSHACPIANCKTPAKDEHLMCWPHWRRVPKFLNGAVFETYRRYERASARAKQGGKSIEETAALMHELTEAHDAYMKARSDAIEAVEAKERA